MIEVFSHERFQKGTSIALHMKYDRFILQNQFSISQGPLTSLWRLLSETLFFLAPSSASVTYRLMPATQRVTHIQK